MRTNADGIALVKLFEGLRLQAYQDDSPGAVWTIGYGCTHGVSPGLTIDAGAAEALLLRDLGYMEALVLGCVKKATLTDNQLSALVSFCFNVGLGKAGLKDGFRELKAGGPSTLLKCLLKRDYEAAALEFPKWSNVGGTESAGILRRRLAEQALFRKGNP